MPPRQFASVYVDSAAALVEKPLTYEVPSRLQESVDVGSYVLVPLRNDSTPAYVVAISNTSERDDVKPVLDLLSEIPFFDRKLLRLARWVSRYYHCPMVDVLRCLAPGGSRQKIEKVFSLSDPEAAHAYLASPPKRGLTRSAILRALVDADRPLTLGQLKEAVVPRRISESLRRLVQEGRILAETSTIDRGAQKRCVKALRLNAEGQALDDKEREVVMAFQCAGGVMALQALKEKKLFTAAARRLLGAGILQWTEMEMQRSPDGIEIDAPKDLELTDEQVVALNTINSAISRRLDMDASVETTDNPDQARVCLLHGVTASGKTEVYLRAIEHCLRLGRQAIVLIPEISLTEQTLCIFRSRFGGKVAVFHSALSRGERFDEWNRVRRGESDIVLGARSAVFAPLRDVGLIIVDEEHDSSYKQESSPRYHAREVALRRAQIENAVVALGSATPSPESYHRAERNKYRLITMTRRVAARNLPEVKIVDLRQVQKDLRAQGESKTLTIFSPSLREAMADRLCRNEQILLFLNRRGFCPVIHCHYCGHVESCAHCSVALTYHQTARLLRCHHCNFMRGAPAVCAHCGAPIVAYLGVGTERVEIEVAKMFPEARLLRMDRDTTTRKGSHARLLDAFRQRQADIMIGTQMISKGLDFPGVTLVGVILADTALYMPDFRASERTFQLLAQVSGRAGRGEVPGEVIIQTYLPEHYSILAAATQDFHSFWTREARVRRQLPYPPLTHLINIVSSATEETQAQLRIREVNAALAQAIGEMGGTEILGPAPCPLSKIKDQYRWHLLLRDRSKPRLHGVLEKTLDQWSPSQRQGLTIDVDPVSLM